MEELVEASVKFIEFDSGRAHEMERPMWEMLLSVGSHGSGTEARSLPCSPLPVQAPAKSTTPSSPGGEAYAAESQAGENCGTPSQAIY